MAECAVLVVEDDEAVRTLIQLVLRKQCSRVDQAPRGDVAIEMLRQSHYDVVVLDLMLPGVNGLEVAGMIETLPVPPKVIVLSAVARYYRDRFPPDAIVLQKPFELDQLGEAVHALTA